MYGDDRPASGTSDLSVKSADMDPGDEPEPVASRGGAYAPVECDRVHVHVHAG